MIRELNEQAVIQKVQRYLDRHKYDTVAFLIREPYVRRDGDRWEIPVYSNELRRTYRYYEELVEVEDELRDNEGLEVLLIPAD